VKLRPRVGDYERDGDSGLLLPRRSLVRAHPQYLGPPFFAEAAGGGGGSDADWANVILRLPLNGADAATSTTDFSVDARAITFNGNAQLDTAQVKYGASSALFDGTDDYLSCSVDPLGTANFTIEMWVRPGNQTKGFPTYFYLNGGQEIYMEYDHGSWPDKFMVFSTQSGNVLESGTLSHSTWYHIAYVRASAVGRLYVDGVNVGGSSSGETANYNNGGACLVTIGQAAGNSNAGFIGHVDDVRVTKNVARYTATFTPPAAEMPTS
jgi:hypothetical protein